MEIDDEATTSQPKDIKRVAKDTVNKICSSQVILNLAVAVKELVENSVDAGATTVEIKIKNFGADGFEVVDNGCGISTENFAGITAKHCTSKLKVFSDLESIRTFGFRGEALSSLCALSNISVTTRDKTTDHGTKLLFDHNGSIVKKTMCARNVGTTVSVTDLFITIPVRRSEFMKNYKKDYAKMVQLLQEYCLCLTGVKILCTNQPPNGSRQTILTTNACTVMENIISIFGAKQAKDLVKIKSPTNDQTEDGIYTQESLVDLDSSNSILDLKQFEIDCLNKSHFKIEGFISKIDHNCARSSKDRQFFYINSRPVELTVVSKLINEVYHRYNLKQFPFIYLNLKMDRSTVDVNLSKDKRQVAICNDTILNLAIKRSLLNTFGELSTKFKRVSINNSVKSRQPADESDSDEEDKITIVEPSNNFGRTLKQWRITPQDPTPLPQPHKRKLSNEPKGQKLPKIKIPFHQKVDEILGRNNSFEKENSFETSQEDVSFKIDCKTRKSINTLKFEVLDKSSTKSLDQPKVEEMQLDEPLPNIQILEKTFMSISQPPSEDENDSETLISQTISKSSSDLSLTMIQSSQSSENEVTFIDSQKPNIFKHSSKIKVSLDSIRSMVKAEEEAYDKIQHEKKSRKLKLRFKETIDPSKNKKAEAELETEIKKEMFKEMEVLGQFNLGFIIAKLNSDLFIVDQHASDEKYNFEDLQNTMKLETQPLVVPEKLELTAIQEMTLIENLKTFEMNGFKFLIDESANAGSKIKIHSKPHSKNWEFGRQDIEEMIFMLDDAPNSICRPSRIRMMLASRACRKSIMIGDAMTKKQMKKLLENMGELDHPWNCPHGRPTLRYLQNLDIIDNIQP